MVVEAEPTLAGRYRLRSVVGKGGMGIVWHAHDQLLDREVAIKEVRLADQLTEAERRSVCRRVIGEARAAAALHHPGVITVYDVVVEDGRPFIVMELLQARSLHEVIAASGPVSPARAAEIGIAVLSVLRAAHAAGILHRDVKPSNVLLATGGRIVLTDFGLAARMERGYGIEDTMAQGLQGSPAYLSPEQVRGEPGGAASDLWSLGATLYAAVEGASPYLRNHVLASLVAVLLGEHEPPEHATPSLRRVIDGLLRQDPCDRMDAAEAAELLERTVAEAERKTRPAAAAAWAGMRAGRMARAAALVGVSATALAVAVVSGSTWATRWGTVDSRDAGRTVLSAARMDPMSYREAGGGYAIDVPSGWTRVTMGDGVRWDDTEGERHLRIRRVHGDPLAAFRGAERALRAAGEYRRIRLESAPALGPDAAQWEFVVRKAHWLRSRVGGYELSFTAPQGRWAPSREVFDTVLRTFRPES